MQVDYVAQAIEEIEAKNPGEPEFLQAVGEVYTSLIPVVGEDPRYEQAKILERIAEPERMIVFRVTWADDDGEVRLNRGFRVQMNSAIGPYKGGLRFHPSVNAGLLKFLAFEQVFKNALTTLPLGGAKGGSDFDPKGRSDAEVARFCQAFMTELQRHIGQFTDVPAGDIGVGTREIGYMFGQYKRIRNEFCGALTGKGYGWGGSLVRPEATGYGIVYFAEEMLATSSESLEGKVCLVSGSGNVAQYTVEKLIARKARPITLSDSSGFIYDPDGIDSEKLDWVMDLKNRRRGRISEYTERFGRATYMATHPREGANALWDISADCAFPCATQNEISGKDAANLVNNGVTLVAEGSNMATVPDGVSFFLASGILYGPAKAVNAGGVSVSGLEMAQDSQRLQWSREEVDEQLRSIMVAIHSHVREEAERYGQAGNYVAGANIAGFRKVAEAMLDEAIV